jgi:hypothetical protein
MGVYVYKVTGKKAYLENGEVANVAVFAYKPTMGFSLDADRLNNKWHRESGAAYCDKAAAEGKRLEWVVMGYKEDDGTISIDPTAYKLPKAKGSFYDTMLDREMETSKVVAAGRNIIID